MFLDPSIVIPAITGGIGFGLIGLGAYHSRHGILKAFALVTAGLTIIFLSAPAILSAFLFVITGTFTSFPGISHLIACSFFLSFICASVC